MSLRIYIELQETIFSRFAMKLNLFLCKVPKHKILTLNAAGIRAIALLRLYDVLIRHNDVE